MYPIGAVQKRSIGRTAGFVPAVSPYLQPHPFQVFLIGSLTVIGSE
jgi:hypothetical protein